MADAELPLYAFQFEAFDRKKTDEGEYQSRTRQVDVTVIATNEDEALEDAKNLIVRENYKLEEIHELTKLHSTKVSRW